MASNIIFPEWLNSNSVRNYPIRENAPRTDVSGIFTIPNDLLVAAQINAPRSYLSGTFFVSKIVSSKAALSVYVSFMSTDGTASEISNIKVEAASFIQFTNFSFVGQGNFSNILGSLTVGNVASTSNLNLGEFEFDPDSTAFEVNTYFISVPTLESVEVYTANDELIYRSNTVLKLKAGENIRLSYESLDDDPYGVVRIDAIDGENYVQPNDCVNAEDLVPPCIRTINNVAPDPNGNFWMEESECIEITENATSNSITIFDTCSQSCCGCVQLEELTSALEQLKQQEDSLRDLISGTQAQQSELIANLIANL